MIFVSNNAWNKLNLIKNATNNNKFIISVSSGGCNGFNYKLEQINNSKFYQLKNEKLKNEKLKNEKLKTTIISNKNVHILVDPLSEYLLYGTKIDYQPQNFDKQIFESKFLFIPDKDFSTTCGCGISFTPKI